MFVRADTLNLSKPEAAALLAHASKDASRPLLWGVGVFPGRGQIAATDGHRLAELSAQDGATCFGCANYIVPRLALETATKACPGGGILRLQNGQIDVFESESVIPIEGLTLATVQFVGPTDPCHDYASVFPPMHSPRPVASMGLNAEYLATLALVSKANKSADLVLYVPEADGVPLLVVMGEWRIVIMPRRAKDPEDEE